MSNEPTAELTAAYAEVAQLAYDPKAVEASPEDPRLPILGLDKLENAVAVDIAQGRNKIRRKLNKALVEAARDKRGWAPKTSEIWLSRELEDQGYICEKHAVFFDTESQIAYHRREKRAVVFTIAGLIFAIVMTVCLIVFVVTTDNKYSKSIKQE